MPLISLIWSPLLLLLLAMPRPVAAESEEVAIGVLAKRGPEQAVTRWSPTADYLTRTIPGHRFTIRPLGFDAIVDAVRNEEIDFLLANSSIYVTMEARFGVSRVATLRNTTGTCGNCFGGVIFTRADRQGIQTLEDLDGRSFMAVDPTSLGGFQVAWRELRDHGIDPYSDFASLRFGGTHDAVVDAVLTGEVAAGAVRTDTLERMAREDRLELNAVKVLHAREVPGFPFLLSTQVYPEWPLARLEGTDRELSRQVAVALLEMDPLGQASQAGRYAGWDVPENYQPVHELQRELHIGAYEHMAHFNLLDVFRRYWPVIGLLGVVLIMLAGGNLVFSRLTRRLRWSESQLREARDTLELRVDERTQELKSQKRELRRNQERLMEAQRIARLGNWEWNLTTNDFWSSEELTRLLGLGPEQTLDCAALLAWSHPDDRAALRQAFARARDEGQGFELEHRITAADGRQCVVHQRAEVVVDENRRPLRVQGTLQDITDQHRTSERLRQAAKVFDSSREGILITDPDGRILAANQALTEITGYTEDEILGKNPRIFQSGRHGEAFYEKLWQSVTETGAWRGEIWNRRKNGDIFPEWQTISAVYDQRGRVTHYVAVFSDLSSIKEARKRLEKLSYFDSLTGLPNRSLLEDRLSHAIERAEAEDKRVGVVFLDIDRFKNVNDSLGHGVGDDILRELGRRLDEALGDGDTIGRIGGDEFVVLLEQVGDAEEVEQRVSGVLRAFQEPFPVEGDAIQLETSLGIAMYPEDGQQVSTLLRNADTAMYRAKERGRNRSQFYTPDLTDAARDRLRLEMALRRAVEERAFEVHYQPQVDLRSGRMVGVEALVRWNSPEFGPVSPGRFIPLAEDAGVIEGLSQHVMESACRDFQQWRASGLELGRLAVNISAIEIHKGNLVDRVREVLGKTGLLAACLEIEVTESVFMDHTDEVLAVFQELRSLGVHISIDDFGTGYSSLAYLQQLPLDQLKIDKSFVQAIDADDSGAAIPRAVIAMGHSLELNVLAEGVETDFQRQWLRDHGCDEGQGFFYSRPVPADEVPRFAEALAVSG